MPVQPRYEINLACGDTVSSPVAPKIGAYRPCIHCDSMRRVVSFTDTYSGAETSEPAATVIAQPADAPATSTPSNGRPIDSWAHDAGLFWSRLSFTAKALDELRNSADAATRPDLAASLEVLAAGIRTCLGNARIDYDSLF